MARVKKFGVVSIYVYPVQGDEFCKEFGGKLAEPETQQDIQDISTAAIQQFPSEPMLLFKKN